MEELKKFITACEHQPTDVIIQKRPKDDASRILGLHTQEDIKDFIANDGIELPIVFTKSPWRNNPTPEKEKIVHAYKFKSVHEQLYIAFFYNDETGKWILKSLHKPEDPRPTLGNIFGGLLTNNQEQGE